MRGHRLYAAVGVTLLLAALLLGLVSASASYERFHASRCFDSCGLVRVYRLWEGVALREGVNVTVVNRGSAPISVNGSVVEPGGAAVYRSALVLNVSGSSCDFCVAVDGVRVEMPYALLSIPAAVLSVAGFALVIYSLMLRVYAG